MELNEYQKEAMRTNDYASDHRLAKELSSDGKLPNVGQILNACLGLSGEVGEVNDSIKKAIFHGHSISKEELVKEIGDCMWYIALMCNALSVSMNDVAEKNIIKLQKRYPEGFTTQASIEREE